MEHGLKKAAEKVCGLYVYKGERQYVDKGERNVKKCGGGMKRLQKLLRGKKRGIRNGGKTGAKRIWYCKAESKGK